MKKKKYLDFYKECLVERNGKMPYAGLCVSLDWDRNVYLFKPRGAMDGHYWANEKIDYDNYKGRIFNPLRQNIVLLMAAMAGEL